MVVKDTRPTSNGRQHRDCRSHGHFPSLFRCKRKLFWRGYQLFFNFKNFYLVVPFPFSSFFVAFYATQHSGKC